MTELECWRARQDLAAYCSGTARDLRDIGKPAAPAALFNLAKWLLWHAPKLDTESEKFAARLSALEARALPIVPRVADTARELVDAARDRCWTSTRPRAEQNASRAWKWKSPTSARCCCREGRLHEDAAMGSDALVGEC